MTKKNMGLARTERIRIHPKVMQDLNIIKKALKMGQKHNESDVIEQLVIMWKNGEVAKTPFLVTRPGKTSPREIELQTRIEEFESLYEDQLKTNQTMVKAVKHLCEKHNENYGDVLDHVKR